jgi:hypothetical protein
MNVMVNLLLGHQHTWLINYVDKNEIHLNI